jgi:hypothetical protein
MFKSLLNERYVCHCALLIKYHTMKTYGPVEVMALDEGEYLLNALSVGTEPPIPIG